MFSKQATYLLLVLNITFKLNLTAYFIVLLQYVSFTLSSLHSGNHTTIIEALVGPL